jgi:cytochrome P450
MPSVIVPKAFKGRLASQNALQEYFIAGYNSDPDVSPYARARAELFRKSGLPEAEIGRFEIANIHVALANASPTFFWLLLFIASDPQLTREIRAELSKIVTATAQEGRHEMTIDITNISEACPLLLSAFQETMRLTDGQVAVRIVMEDTILSDSKNSYLLKKGATVQIPGGILHNSTTFWGPDAATFNPRRFLKPEPHPSKTAMPEADKEQEKLRKKAFVPFGGGTHLCPGRHFASGEILGSVAVLIMGYDITTRDGAALPAPVAGEWKTIKFGEAVAKPVGRLTGVGARIRRRRGFEDVIWAFETGWRSE